MKNSKHFRMMALTAAGLIWAAGSCMAMDKDPSAGAPEHKQERGSGGEDHWKNAEKELGLTPEQGLKMKALRDEARAKQDGLKAQAKARHEALRKELDSATPDRVKAEALVKEASSLEEQMGMNRVDMAFKVRQILTPEQFQKLREFHEKNKGKMKGHHDKKGSEEGEKDKDAK